MKNEKGTQKKQVSVTDTQVTKDKLSSMSKDEVLKVIFDRPVTKIKEGGHAKYAR